MKIKMRRSKVVDGVPRLKNSVADVSDQEGKVAVGAGYADVHVCDESCGELSAKVVTETRTKVRKTRTKG